MQSRDKKEFNPSIRLLEGLIGRLQKIRWFDSSVQIDDIGVWLRSQVEWSVKIHLQRLRLLKFVKPGFGKHKVNYLRDSWSTAWNVNGDCKQLLDDLNSKARLLGDKLLQENAQKNQWRLEIKDKISDFFDDKLSAVETAPKGLTENDRRGVVRAIKSARRDCRSIASGFVCG